MASVHDVAAYILRLGPMDAMKLQKLAYYCQAWHLAWQGEPLFKSRIEAWRAGPVVRELYRDHRRQLAVHSWPKGDPGRVPAESAAVMDAVLDYYGDKTGFWLSELAHREAPWRDAREGVPETAPSNVEITEAAMAAYYGSLAHDG